MTDLLKTKLKKTLLTAAVMALPGTVFAQVPTDTMKDELKDQAVQELGDQAAEELGENTQLEDADPAIITDAEPSFEDQILDGLTPDTTDDAPVESLEGGMMEMETETTPNEEWASEQDKGSATTYSSPAECPDGTELAEDGSCMLLDDN